MADDSVLEEAEARQRHLEEVVLGPAVYTGEQVAEAAGMTLEDAERLWAELGFPPVAPDVRHFTEADADVLRQVTDFRQWDLIGFEDILSMTRVLGQALARAAGAQARLTLAGVTDQLPDSDSPPDDAARLDAAVELGVEVSERFLSYIWRRHLVAALTRAFDPRPTETVGFADLVGYTRLTTKLDPSELPTLVSRFQQVAATSVVPAGGQVVKLIGDAVMFVAPDPLSASQAALGILAGLSEEPDAPGVRIGLSMGPLVHLEGDVYGDTVNRASRLAELAHPDSVLVDDAVAAALSDQPELSVRPIRPHRLKGIGLVRAWTVRRAGQRR